MATINSNIFTIDNIKEEPIQTFKEKLNIDNGITEFNKYKFILEECKSILNKCKSNKLINFEEVQLTKQNFETYHYSLLKGRYIIVLYDKESKTYKYLTSSGTIFIVTDLDLVKTIHEIPLPTKLTYDFVPRVSNEIVLSFKAICGVLYNVYSNNPSNIIKGFLKGGEVHSEQSEYSILMNIFEIFPKLEHIITKNQYWKYIYLENDIYYISKYSAYIDLEVDSDYLDNMYVDVTTRLKELSSDLDINLKILTSNIQTLKYLKDNTNITPTLDPYLLNKYDNSKVIELITLYNKYRWLSSVKLDKLPTPKTHTDKGSLDEFISEVINVYPTKKIIKATYGDIFFKILASLTYNKEMIDLSNGSSLIKSLLKEDELTTDLNLYYTTHYIKGLLNNISSDQDMMLHFQNNLKTIIYPTDLENVKTIYNTNLVKLKNLIDDFNNVKYVNHKTNILNHVETSNLNRVILHKERLIKKTLIKDLYEYTTDFNIKNKYKIHLYKIYNDELYLICDNEALSVAVDLLTRQMPTTFNKFVPNIVAECSIDVLE